MEPELDEHDAVSQSAQGFGIPLPISQNACSTQETTIRTSSLTPVQKARMARQKELALARCRERREQHHRLPQRHDTSTVAQRHDTSTVALSPCTQLLSSQAHAADMLNNVTGNSETTLKIFENSQNYPFFPTSDCADSCFYQDRHRFTQAKLDGAQPKTFYNSGSCTPHILFESGSTATLTQSNSYYHSGSATSLTQSYRAGATASLFHQNLIDTNTNAGVANLRQERESPCGVVLGASDESCHQVKRACFSELDWNRNSLNGDSSVDESEPKRAFPFNSRVDGTSLSKTGEHDSKLVLEAQTSNPGIPLLSDPGNLCPSVTHTQKWILSSPRADIALLQYPYKKDDYALDNHRLKSEAQDDSDEPACVRRSLASDSAVGSQYFGMLQSEQGIQACHVAFSNFCSNGEQGFARPESGTFEAASIHEPALNRSSEEAGGMKVKQESRRTGMGGGKRADIIELSDDDEVTGKAVVVELLDDDDHSLKKAGIIEASRVDGARQNWTSSANLGSLYQTENRGFNEESFKHTNLTVSKTEEDLAAYTIQNSPYTIHELVRSAAGFIYYRMQGLEDDEKKGTNMFQSEPYKMEENEDDTFIPTTVLPSSLSRQQQLVLKAAAEGKSIFLTGAAGTGKSFLLGFVIDILRRRLGQRSVFVAASTGLAACALNGTTIHSFAGIGLGKERQDLLASKVLGSREAMNRWRNARALVIDEVSMIDGELFDKLDYVAKNVRAESLKDEPLSQSFGGIQLIVTGDFFQLPPVKPVNQQKFFAFEAGCWDKCFDVQIELKQVFRQDDGNFVGMLNKIRRGTHTPETLLPLQRCIRDLPENGSGIQATRLYPLKHDVNQENLSTLRMLKREIVEFSALDQASGSYYRSMLQHMRTGNTLPLCIGAQVMLVKNLDTNSGLVNGARGVVVGFSSVSVLHDKDVDANAVAAAISANGQWPVVQFVSDASQRVIGPHKDSIEDGGREVASRIQVPLILAWALSVHKCQGMTLDRVKMDLSSAFGFGMVYVALSRVKNLNGLQLTGLDPSAIKAHPRVVQFYTKLDKKTLSL